MPIILNYPIFGFCFIKLEICPFCHFGQYFKCSIPHDSLVPEDVCRLVHQSGQHRYVPHGVGGDGVGVLFPALEVAVDQLFHVTTDSPQVGVVL